MQPLSDEQRDELIDMYRDAFNDAIDNGELREEASDTALTAVSDSPLGDLFNDAWDVDEELREAISNINSTATEDDDDYFNDDYDDDGY